MDEIALQLARTGAVTNARLRVETGVDRQLALHMLRRLVDAGKLVQRGSKRGTRQPAVLLAATILVAAMWNGILFLVALKNQDHTAVLGLQPLFMPIVMFSTFFAPTDAMPGWFKTVVNLNPFTHVLAGARSVLAADADLAALAVGLGAFVAIGAITFATSATTLRSLVGND